MPFTIRRAAAAFFTGLLAVTALSACGSDDDDDAPAVAQIRAIHASADTGAVDVYLDGARAAAGATFGQATGFATVPAQATRVQVTLANQPTSIAALEVGSLASVTCTRVACAGTVAKPVAWPKVAPAAARAPSR